MVGILMLALNFGLQAQQSIYIFDQSGNLASITETNIVAPSVGIQLQSALLYSNYPVTLSVVANGSGLFYQWYSNGIPISGATGDSLLLTNLPVGNYTNFTVVVSNVTGAVTSAPAAIWADSNGNGMPDDWESQYFGNLNQTAASDFDGDGVNNLDEYLEGTNPTNKNIYDPRLHIFVSGAGSVEVTPLQRYYAMGQTVTITAVPNPGSVFLGWGGALTGPTNPATLALNSHKSIEAAFTPSIIDCTPALPGLAAWWPADGNAMDEAGTNVGTLFGSATFAPGEVSEAFSFDGVNGYVSVPTSPSLNLTNAMTIEGWIELNNLSDYQFIATKQPSGTAANNIGGNFEFRVQPNGYLQLLHQTDSGGNYSSYVALTPITAGTLHHVAVTLVAGGTVNLYVDGLPVGTFSQQGIFGLTNAQPLLIGTRKDHFSYFNVLIDELSIYNRALSASEISSIYLARSIGKCAPPPVSFSFDISNGAFQWTTNGVNLTLTGIMADGPVIIYASTNLSLWTPIFTNPPTTGTLQLLDSAATNYSFRFYRAVEP
jgi:hypothetical protein